jgi:hypothetical protein
VGFDLLLLVICILVILLLKIYLDGVGVANVGRTGKDWGNMGDWAFRHLCANYGYNGVRKWNISKKCNFVFNEFSFMEIVCYFVV